MRLISIIAIRSCKKRLKLGDQAWCKTGIQLCFGGVSANFQEQRIKVSIVRSPTTSDIGIASVISFKSSLLSFTFNEPILLSRFFIFVVPTKHELRYKCHALIKLAQFMPFLCSISVVQHYNLCRYTILCFYVSHT